jgi:hypothetical protein
VVLFRNDGCTVPPKLELALSERLKNLDAVLTLPYTLAVYHQAIDICPKYTLTIKEDKDAWPTLVSKA